MKKLRKYGRKIKEILHDDHTTAYYYSDEKIERARATTKLGRAFGKRRV